MSEPVKEALSIPLLLASLFLGVCCLFPYNSFLSSPNYLENYYQYAAVKDIASESDRPKPENESFWKNVSNWATVMLLVPMALSQVLMITPMMLRLNVQIRMISGAVLLFIAMLLLPVCASGGGISEKGSIAVVLIACILTGGSSSLLQSALYSLCGTLPTMYMSLFVFGGGLSGTLNSLLRIVIHFAMATTFSATKNGAVVFYVVNMVLMALTVAITFLLRYNSVVKQYCRAYSLDSGVMTDPALLEAAEPESEESKSAHSNEPATADEPVAEASDSGVLSVAPRIWVMMLCVFLTMFTTLTYFPGFGLKAMASDSTGDLMPMVIILMYNLGDTIGRLVPTVQALWLPKKGTVGLVLARIIVCLIPLVLGVVSPKVIDSNANPIVVFLFLGATNGYLVGLLFAYGCSDESLKTESDHATAGTCMAFALLIGCSAGSVLALILVMFALE